MKPAARLSAAIEILDDWAAGGVPIDAILTRWGRSHRFAGAKDRAAIADQVYAALKRRTRLIARMGAETGRAMVLAGLADEQAMTATVIDELLRTGGPHAPQPLTPEERAALDAPLPDLEPWITGSYPKWLHGELDQAFGADLPGEAQSWLERAPLDLRVNTLKAMRDDVARALEAQGLFPQSTPFSPVGLRLPAGTSITSSALYRDGQIEIQDEGSQLAVLAAEARPGMTVCELGAGAGGKSLALAAAMENRGIIIAADIAPARLERIAARAARAGVSIVEERVTGEGEALDDLADTCDLVLIDAPCSGSGTWRRDPENKWRLTPDMLAQRIDVQRRLLAMGSRLVRPGGSLVYVTCSVLPSENERQIDTFLKADRRFSSVARCPEMLAHQALPWRDGILSLAPGRAGTDGFFIARLARSRQA